MACHLILQGQELVLETFLENSAPALRLLSKPGFDFKQAKSDFPALLQATFQTTLWIRPSALPAWLGLCWFHYCMNTARSDQPKGPNTFSLTLCSNRCPEKGQASALPWSVLSLPSKRVSLCLKAFCLSSLFLNPCQLLALPSLLWQAAPLVNFWEFIFFFLLACALHAFPPFADLYKIFWPLCFPAEEF